MRAKPLTSYFPFTDFSWFSSVSLYLFVCYLSTFTYTFFIYILFIYDSVQKNERKKERLIIYLSQKSLAQRQRLHETLGIKKINLMWKFQNRKRKRNFYSYFFRNLLTLIFFASSLLREQHARKNKVKNNILTFILLQVEWCSNVNVWLVVWWLNPFLLQCLYKLVFFIKLNYSLLLSPHH